MNLVVIKCTLLVLVGIVVVLALGWCIVDTIKSLIALHEKKHLHVVLIQDGIDELNRYLSKFKPSEIAFINSVHVPNLGLVFTVAVKI